MNLTWKDTAFYSHLWDGAALYASAGVSGIQTAPRNQGNHKNKFSGVACCGD
jgi:hypothetical protein